MIPELVKAACSMLGAWGPATSKSTAGLIQLRALDWGLDSPLVRFHQLTVYKPPPLTSTPIRILSITLTGTTPPTARGRLRRWGGRAS